MHLIILSWIDNINAHLMQAYEARDFIGNLLKSAYIPCEVAHL